MTSPTPDVFYKDLYDAFDRVKSYFPQGMAIEREVSSMSPEQKKQVEHSMNGAMIHGATGINKCNIDYSELTQATSTIFAATLMTYLVERAPDKFESLVTRERNKAGERPDSGKASIWAYKVAPADRRAPYDACVVSYANGYSFLCDPVKGAPYPIKTPSDIIFNKGLLNKDAIGLGSGLDGEYQREMFEMPRAKAIIQEKEKLLQAAPGPRSV